MFNSKTKLTLADNGSALILALWTLLFLSIIAIYSGSMVRQEILVRKKIEARDKLYSIVYSGMLKSINMVRAEKKRDLTFDSDSLNDFWAHNLGAFRNVKLSNGRFSVSYTYFNNVTGRKERKYGVVDEERKININFASKEMIERLFSSLGIFDPVIVSQVVSSLIDWRDGDDILNNDERNLSERVDYSNSGYEYHPSNVELKNLEELLLIKGLSKDVFLKIRDHITVFSNGKVNINTASKTTLFSLGLSDTLVYKIANFRSGPDMTEGTFDDNIFSSLVDIESELSSYYDLSDKEKEDLDKVIEEGNLDISSSTFTAHCRGSLDDDDLQARIICVFDRGGKIKYWGYQYVNSEEF